MRVAMVAVVAALLVACPVAAQGTGTGTGTGTGAETRASTPGATDGGLTAPHASGALSPRAASRGAFLGATGTEGRASTPGATDGGLTAPHASGALSPRAASRGAFLETPHVKATILGPDPAWVGQMVPIDVSLYRDARADNAAPHFAEPRVRGAIAMRAQWAPPPAEERVDGVRYLVQTRRYLVFPQRDGRVEVPGISVSWVDAETDIAVAVTTDAVYFEAEHPPVIGGEVLLVAEGVTVEQTVTPDLGDLRVGDAFTREVTIRAEATDATLLPSVTFPAVTGLSVYPAEAVSRTYVTRGHFVATRTERATYVVTDWGSYELPPITVHWLEPSSGESHVAQADAVSFRARVNPSLGFGCLGTREGVLRRGGLFALLVLVLAGAWLLVRRARRRYAAGRAVVRTSEEGRRWRALASAAKDGASVEMLRAAYDWLAVALPDGTTPTLNALRTAEPGIESATLTLEEQLYGGVVHRAVDIDALMNELRAFRRARRGAVGHELPPLN